MHIICLTPLAPGVYNDHRADHIAAPPPGWAMIPEDFPLPATFPRLGSVEAAELVHTREVEDLDGDGSPVTKTLTYPMMTVTAMAEGTLPEHTAAEAPSPLDRLEAQMTYTAMMTDTLLEV